MTESMIITSGELTADTFWILIGFAIITLLSWLLSIVWYVKFKKLRKMLPIKYLNKKRTDSFYFE